MSIPSIGPNTGFKNTKDITKDDEAYITQKYNEAQRKSESMGQLLDYKSPIETKSDRMLKAFKKDWNAAKVDKEGGLVGGPNNDYSKIKDAILKNLLKNIK